MADYNGWKNRATWTILLWADNCEYSYHALNRAVGREYHEIDATKAQMIMRTLDLDTNRDMNYREDAPVGHRPQDVDWSEIAEHLEERRLEMYEDINGEPWTE